ncbi:phage holin family protein [Nocardioides panacisoli]|uniref:phage holin family protein n=1 Tax=Nocardioides panacisoli TaxID=627624 RepID=UPI001C636923|nr:phage holin family protein [Nocardioides panacisoli]QYJ03158.1 phage holin family protein [Nocardioides panacisoli]
MAEQTAPNPNGLQDDEPTIGRLIKDAQTDLSTLMRKEIELAKAELKFSATAGGMGTVFLLAAAFFAVLMIIILSVAAAYFIHWNGDGLSLHWAFLIVAGFYLLITGLLVLLGIRKLKQIKGPEKTIETGRKVPKALKGSTSTN